MIPLTVENIASICHEANRRLCNLMGDHSQAAWAATPERLQGSIIAGVQFALDNPEAEPGAQHEAWCNYKLSQGYVYGESKNEDAKTHPQLVPFEDLPLEQQTKDVLFTSIVRALEPLMHDSTGAMESTIGGGVTRPHEVDSLPSHTSTAKAPTPKARKKK